MKWSNRCFVFGLWLLTTFGCKVFLAFLILNKSKLHYQSCYALYRNIIDRISRKLPIIQPPNKKTGMSSGRGGPNSDDMTIEQFYELQSQFCWFEYFSWLREFNVFHYWYQKCIKNQKIAEQFYFRLHLSTDKTKREWILNWFRKIVCCCSTCVCASPVLRLDSIDCVKSA